jgi:hypothetical protein
MFGISKGPFILESMSRSIWMYSFKFLPSDIEFLCNQTDFSVVKHFSDKQAYFIDSLWRVVKEATKASGRDDVSSAKHR